MSFKFFTVQTFKTMQSRQTNSKQINRAGKRGQTLQDTQYTPPDSQTNKRTYLQLQLVTGRRRDRNEALSRIEKRAKRWGAASNEVKSLITMQLFYNFKDIGWRIIKHTYVVIYIEWYSKEDEKIVIIVEAYNCFKISMYYLQKNKMYS